MLRVALLSLILCGGLAIVDGEASAAREAQTVAEQYDRGIRYMERGYYTKAVEAFNRIRNYYRDDPYAVRAELAIADVYFQKHEWDQARLAYDDFMRMHPRNESLDYVVFRLGLTLYNKAPKAAGRDQTWSRQAINTWAGFDSRFPDSDHREDVQRHLTECRERLARKEILIARFYERREAWTSVLGRVNGVIRTYPDSEYVTEALSLKTLAYAYLGDVALAEATLERVQEIDPEQAERLSRKLDGIPNP